MNMEAHTGPEEAAAQETGLKLPKWEMLPDIGLYMDQVITLMERTFSPALPKGEITKSMVNNYVKVELIPRPVGKKYDREHLALLMMIGVLKQALSMESVAQMLALLCAQGVQSGYTRFAREVDQLERALEQGRLDLSLGSDSPQEKALHAGVTAAVCTISANRLLARAHRGGEKAQQG